ncbi:putative integral membrane protein [Octadecabacter arcticus 238]|uniref:Putative integral membrane protein n=1 Tax=Octadecabacter arcticus 238 TaxID=391616 RepID=M9RNI9_9RHOB|nr:DMT family transporter [Octadecabacter arcticus]AGI73767.1 putative integral membrane protein [Octadecabacter arcticus 238]
MSRPVWLLLAPVLFLILWSGGYVVAKVGLLHAAPMAILAMRYACVIVIMTVLFMIFRPPLPTKHIDWLHLAIVGILIQTVYFGLTYLAFVNGVAAGTAALMMILQPILVALIAPKWSGERIGWRQWGGLLIALAGTTAVIASRLDIGPPPVLGFVFVLLGLAGITGATLWEKRFGLSHHPITANLIGYAAGLICLLPFLYLEDAQPILWDWEFFAVMVYLVIGNSVIAVGLLLSMIRAGEVARVSTLLFLVPPGAALAAWLVLDEAMPLIAWIGMAIAGAGVLIATRK